MTVVCHWRDAVDGVFSSGGLSCVEARLGRHFVVLRAQAKRLVPERPVRRITLRMPITPPVKGRGGRDARHLSGPPLHRWPTLLTAGEVTVPVAGPLR